MGYMLSCTNETEIKLFAFPPEGSDAVETINTNQTKNHQLKMSPDGTFFACATHASEVKVWRVDTGAARTPGSNDGAPTGCSKAGVLLATREVFGASTGALTAARLSPRRRMAHGACTTWQTGFRFASVSAKAI